MCCVKPLQSKELASCLASSRLLCNFFNLLAHSLTASDEGTAWAAALASAEAESPRVWASLVASSP